MYSSIKSYHWITLCDQSLILNLHILHREGMILYINGEETVRSNIGYNSHPSQFFAATNLFHYPLSRQYSFSSNLLQNGTNVFAVKIHVHKLSSLNIHFHILANLLSVTKLYQIAPFPSVTATNDFYHANTIVNNYRDYNYFWSGKHMDSIYSYESFSGYSYINTIQITRLNECVPERVRVWGIFGDYEEGSQFLSHTSLLLESELPLSKGKVIDLPINSDSLGYRGYRLQFLKSVASADCLQLHAITFYTKKEVSCREGGVNVNIGDSLRKPCQDDKIGVVVQKCTQTSSGSEWSDPISYCCNSSFLSGECLSIDPNGVVMNQNRLWFTIQISSLSRKKELVEALLKEKLKEVLNIPINAISIYYHYTKQTTELFSYNEYYIYIHCNSLLQFSLIHKFNKSVDVFKRHLLDDLNQEVLVEILDVVAVENTMMVSILYSILFIVLLLVIFCMIYTICTKQKKEKQDNVYLLA